MALIFPKQTRFLQPCFALQIAVQITYKCTVFASCEIILRIIYGLNFEACFALPNTVFYTVFPTVQASCEFILRINYGPNSWPITVQFALQIAVQTRPKHTQFALQIAHSGLVWI